MRSRRLRGRWASAAGDSSPAGGAAPPGSWPPGRTADAGSSTALAPRRHCLPRRLCCGGVVASGVRTGLRPVRRTRQNRKNDGAHPFSHRHGRPTDRTGALADTDRHRRTPREGRCRRSLRVPAHAGGDHVGGRRWAPDGGGGHVRGTGARCPRRADANMADIVRPEPGSVTDACSAPEMDPGGIGAILMAGPAPVRSSASLRCLNPRCGPVLAGPETPTTCSGHRCRPWRQALPGAPRHSSPS